MKTKSQHESLLWQVLTKQRLADFSQFYAAGFFDEIPFYSRYADVESPDGLAARQCLETLE